MPRNPYVDAASKYFRIVLGGLACLGCAGLATLQLVAGEAGDLGRTGKVLGVHWTAADHPAQFWFIVVFWVVLAFLTGRDAWKAFQQ
jgi:hypothetical protein